MRVILILLFSILFTCHIGAQVIYSQKDIQFFDAVLWEAKKTNLSDSSIDKIVLHVGKLFLGKPYVGGILDRPATENLVINLNGLDCVTYLESAIALSMIIKQNKTGFEDFCSELKFIRYRNGVMDGYASRLHYFYDWINDNQQKGILENITANIGGQFFVKDINIMSQNRIKYPHLKEDSSLIILKKIEEELSSMNKFYIPKEEIQLSENQIQDGDLVAIATTIYGLEVAHVGIVIHINKELHIMHASSLNKKVEISEVSLSEILKNNSTYSGIIISRLKI